MGSKEFLCSNPSLKYNSFKELEEHLYRFLTNKSYEAASFLISEGIKITENVETILNQIIAEGNVEILETIFKHHMSSFMLLDFDKFMVFAAELGQFEVFKFLNTWDFDRNHYKLNIFYSNLAKMAIERDHYHIFDYIIETRPISNRITFLSSLLKFAMSKRSFHVIKRCAENKVTFILLNPDQRIEALRLAAMNDCVITTNEILKINSVLESVKNRCDELDSPQSIAKRFGKKNVMKIYSSMMKI